jgi:tRNA uridine 5-carboxymethylaminomethyl modification enzyme
MSNAEERLAEFGRQYRVLPEEKYARLQLRQQHLQALEDKFNSIALTPAQLPKILPEFANPVMHSSASLAQLLRRPEAELASFQRLVPEVEELDLLAKFELEARIKYSGYLVQQQKEYELRESMTRFEIPAGFIDDLPGAVSKEARMKIEAVRPKTVGELEKIPGVRASDMAVILMTLKKNARRKIDE